MRLDSFSPSNPDGPSFGTDIGEVGQIIQLSLLFLQLLHLSLKVGDLRVLPGELCDFSRNLSILYFELLHAKMEQFISLSEHGLTAYQVRLRQGNLITSGQQLSLSLGLFCQHIGNFSSQHCRSILYF